MSSSTPLPVRAEVSASTPISLQGLATLARREGGPPAAEVAREFESLLIGEMLRPASKPLFEGGLLDGGSAAQMYREHFFQEVARLAASRGSFGLAREIERELGRAGGSTDEVRPEPDVATSRRR